VVNAAFVSVAGDLVINPFDPNARLQQWIITERHIQNRRNPNTVLQVRTKNKSELTRDVTAAEYDGLDVQLWSITHVYVDS